MPAIDVREDYRMRKYARTPQGYTAEMGWTVAWAPSALAAEEAVGVTVNAQFQFQTLLRCNYCRCEEYNFNLSKVRATFVQPPSKLLDLSDPLNQAPRIRWRLCSRTISVDRDVYSNAITNSAGDAFRTPAHLESPILAFTIYRNEATYNPQETIAYLNKYNSANWAPLGIPNLQPGQARCTSILPTQEYTYDGLVFLTIAYDFEVDGGFLQDPDQVFDAWRYRVLDQGSMGWYTDGGSTKRGVFCDGAGNPLSTDVLMDGTGKPLLGNVMVLNPTDPTTPYTPVSNPNWTSKGNPSPPPGVYIDHGNIPNDPTTWITYDVRRNADFNALGF